MSTLNRPRTRGVHGRRGFTLIEVVAVMIIVGIMAAASVPAMQRIGQARTVAAARDIQRDIAWARQHAVATGLTTWVVFDAGADSWTLLVEDPDSPGRAGATVLTDASTGSDWIVTLGTGPFVDTALTAVAFDGGTEIGFDWMGRPRNAAEADLAVRGSVTVTGGHVITVEAGTGLPQFVEP